MPHSFFVRFVYDRNRRVNCNQHALVARDEVFLTQKIVLVQIANLAHLDAHTLRRACARWLA